MNKYTIVVSEPFATFPAWVAALPEQRRHARGKTVTGQKIKAGTRNATLISIAGKLRRMGLVEIEILAALMGVNRTRCEPPLETEELRTIARSAASYKAEDMIEVIEEKEIVVFSLFDAMEPQPPIDWVVEGLIAESSVTLLVGKGGSKKTYAMLDLAVCVATGADWLGFPTTKQAVLFIDEETGTKRLKRRLGAVGRGHLLERSDAKDTPVFCTSLANYDLLTVDGLLRLEKALEMTKARVVILDALVDFMLGGDENAVQDVQRVFHGLREISDRTGVTAVVIHHPSKTGTYRGSTAMRNAVDLMLNVKSDKGSNLILFETDKARDIEPIDFAALSHFEAGDVWLTPTLIDVAKAEEGHLAKSEQYVYDFLQDEGATRTVTITSNKPDNVKKGAIRKAIQRLVRRGLIKRIDEGAAGQEATYDLAARGMEQNEIPGFD